MTSRHKSNLIPPSIIWPIRPFLVTGEQIDAEQAINEHAEVYSPETGSIEETTHVDDEVLITDRIPLTHGNTFDFHTGEISIAPGGI